MQTSYIRYGRRYSIPSTAQLLDELKAGFVEGYVPISQGYKAPAQPGERDDKADDPDGKAKTVA